jgi:hypothetical protein
MAVPGIVVPADLKNILVPLYFASNTVICFQCWVVVIVPQFQELPFPSIKYVASIFHETPLKSGKNVI